MKRYKKQDEVSYTLGISLTFFLLETKPEQVKRVFIHSSFLQNETYEKLVSLCSKVNVPIEESNKVFNVLANKENCYVIGEFTKFESLIDNNKPHIVLVNPSNIGNLGTIIRTSIGFGINDIAIIKPGVDIYDPKTIRASMGSVFNLRFQYFDNFQDYLNHVYNNRNLYLFMLRNSKSLKEVEIKKPYSLVFGNEATGLPDDYYKYGESVKIEHYDTIDSLNLAIAVGIGLYEFTKNKF